MFGITVRERSEPESLGCIVPAAPLLQTRIEDRALSLASITRLYQWVEQQYGAEIRALYAGYQDFTTRITSRNCSLPSVFVAFPLGCESDNIAIRKTRSSRSGIERRVVLGQEFQKFTGTFAKNRTGNLESLTIITRNWSHEI